MQLASCTHRRSPASNPRAASNPATRPARASISAKVYSLPAHSRPISSVRGIIPLGGGSALRATTRDQRRDLFLAVAQFDENVARVLTHAGRHARRIFFEPIDIERVAHGPESRRNLGKYAVLSRLWVDDYLARMR